MSENQFYKTNLRNFLTSTLSDEEKERFVELIEKVSRGRNDIIYFSEELLGIPLNKFQKRFLKRSTTPRSKWREVFDNIPDTFEDIGGMLFGKNIACPSNQIGKTVMISIKHIWMCYYKIGLDLDGKLIDQAYYSTLNISPHSRQVKQCYQYVEEILEQKFIINIEQKKSINELHPLLKDFRVGGNKNLGELRFSNKSIFYSVPVGQDQGASLAGGQFAYISYDECAQSLHLRNELGAKILSRLIKYGVCLDLISTPEVDSPSHQYYMHIMRVGLAMADGWYTETGILDDNEFIPKEQRERIKVDLLSTDPNKYRQVVMGDFITGGKRFFDAAEIENLWKLDSKQPCKKNHSYLLVADWGMADTGDPSVFKILDYTDYLKSGKIKIVSHEEIKGGSPQMQFALLRTLYEEYTWARDDGTEKQPIFLMDAEALGGVLIKKLLVNLKPKAFSIDKDEALFMLKKEMSLGRKFEISEVDGSTIEHNPEFGSIESYYIEELNEQLGTYHIEDKKLKKDYVMTLMMGISYIIKKIPKGQVKKVEMNTLAGYNAIIQQDNKVSATTRNKLY